MNLEDELRGALRTRADDAGTDGALLERVRTGVHRDGRRRAVVAGAAVAAAVALTAAVPLAAGQATGPDTGSSSAPPPPTTPAPPPVALVWGPPTYQLPRFPLTPTWEPAKLGRRDVHFLHGQGQIAYIDLKRVSPTLYVQVTAAGPTWKSEWKDRIPTTVSGRPAELLVGTGDPELPAFGLTWRLADGRWLAMATDGMLSRGELLRYAESMRPTPLNLPPVFTVESAPRGFVVTELGPYELCLAPPEDPDRLDDPDRPNLCMSRETEWSPRPGGPRPDADGTIVDIDSGGSWELNRPLGQGRWLNVGADARLGLTREALVRFANGVRVR